MLFQQPVESGRPSGTLQRSAKCFEKLVDRSEIGIVVANNFGIRGLERLLGRNSIEPALEGQLFVVGKIESDDNANVSADILLLASGLFRFLSFRGRLFLSAGLPFTGLFFG